LVETPVSDDRETAAELWESRQIVVAGVGAFWCAGVLAMLLRWACGAWFLRRLRRGAVEVSGPAADLFSACSAELGVGSMVRLAVHARVRSPVLHGLFRPMILVPIDWPSRPAIVQRAGLLHELAHVRRRDHWLTPLLQWVRVTFFFHPLVRRLLTRLEHERELLCDETVIHRGIDRCDYARMLLDFARQSGRFALPRLSGPYLPIGRRRTIKARIHHLLEENMERSTGPLPIRWAVGLGTCLLALMLGVASYRVWAEEPEKTSEPSMPDKPRASPEEKSKTKDTPDKQQNARTNREALRYGGKNFDQWRTDLMTELKPAIRIDGMKALAAFGANGYGPEATRAILEMMRGYDVTITDPGSPTDPKDEDRTVVERAYWAITKIGPSAVPVLIAAVKEENRNVRRFAIETLSNFGSDARSAMPALLQAMKSDDVETRRRAIDALRIDPTSKDIVAALVGALRDQDEEARFRAVQAIQNVGEQAKSAAPALIAVLREKNDPLRIAALRSLKAIGAKKECAAAAVPFLGDKDQSIRQNVYGILQSLGADAKEAVPAASRLLRGKDQNMRQEAYNFLDSLGANAKEAVPELIAVLKDPDDLLQIRAVITLGTIGPAAKEAIPALSELLKTEDENLRKHVRSALKKINP
jgi:HEAT repeat protein/beta-lactamase regulating signal transducer with metallopeptidase domain